MVAYEFYLHDETGGAYLVGVLPERRTDPKRITKDSIMNWAKCVIGESLQAEKLYFSEVEI